MEEVWCRNVPDKLGLVSWRERCEEASTQISVEAATPQFQAVIADLFTLMMTDKDISEDHIRAAIRECIGIETEYLVYQEGTEWIGNLVLGNWSSPLDRLRNLISKLNECRSEEAQVKRELGDMVAGAAVDLHPSHLRPLLLLQNKELKLKKLLSEMVSTLQLAHFPEGGAGSALSPVHPDDRRFRKQTDPVFTSDTPPVQVRKGVTYTYQGSYSELDHPLASGAPVYCAGISENHVFVNQLTRSPGAGEEPHWDDLNDYAIPVDTDKGQRSVPLVSIPPAIA
jgi:hypothetical protein